MQSSTTPVRWYLGFLKKYRVRYIIGLILVAVTSVLVMINPKITGRIVDDVINGGKYDKLAFLLLLMVGTTVLRAGLRFIFLMCFESSSQGLIYDMREECYRRLMTEDFAFFNSNRTGDLMSRQTGDIDAVRHMTSHVIYFTFENVLVFVFALVMLFTVEARMALAMCLVLPITLSVTLAQMKQIRPAFANVRDHFSSLNAFAQEFIAGIRVVKAFASEDHEMDKFTVQNEGYRDAQLRAAGVWMKFVPMFEILSQALTVILLIAGGFMVIDGRMTLGNMVTVNGYLWMLNSPLRQAGWIINDIQRFMASIEKIFAVYSTSPEIHEPEQPKKLASGRLKGEIEFSHVDYLANDYFVLRDISFHAVPGQTIGIIGATGSGKSSLINLIARFYDVTRGAVLVDGTDVRELDLNQLRGSIGTAMQDVFLFSDTIADNIAFGDPNCSREEIIRAAKISGAHDFIMEMPEQYDTIVGERGVGLSGGQKQRISLARAILKRPSILILDDTTSAIDMETEAAIQQNLAAITGECTVFIIAHRISSIIHADQILVLDGGRIVERGTHDQLLTRNGYYATVFNHQYGEFEQFRKIRADKGKEVLHGTK